jgi:uncharacterized iron-regulated membrane protein
VTQPFAGRVRRLWLNVHLWLGVGLFVVLVPLGISGSLLVWDGALDRLLHPARFEAAGPADLPASAYLAAATQGFGDGARPTQVRLPEKPGDPVVVIGRVAGPVAPGARPRTLTAWIDPGKGTLLGVAETRRELIGTMHALHGNLMMSPDLGRKVVGWLGWAMFVSSATGLWLWWPRNGAVLKALRWRRSPSTLFNLHHMTGFWICVPLAILSLTGVYIAFPKTSHALFGVPAPAAPQGGARPGGAPPLAKTVMTIDQAVSGAQVWAPGARVSMIVLPASGDEPAWRVQFAGGKGRTPKIVKVYDANGEAEPTGPQQGGGKDPISRAMRSLHDGGGTGPIWQAIIFAAGLAPTVLGLSGIVMWLRRRARRGRVAHAAAAQ